MKHSKITMGKCSGMEIGRKCFSIGGTTYRVGDTIKSVKLYVSQNEYFETDARLTSTNVRKKTASFRGITPPTLKAVKLIERYRRHIRNLLHKIMERNQQ
jgi:hypothetical protein